MPSESALRKLESYSCLISSPEGLVLYGNQPSWALGLLGTKDDVGCGSPGSLVSRVVCKFSVS